jgi:hypothetical protein
MSKTYFILKEDTKTLEYYTSGSLFIKYSREKFCHMNEIKEVGNIDFLIDRLRYNGVMIFEITKIQNPQVYKVISGNITFNSIKEAVEYCQANKLSTAAESYIKTAIMKNLMNKTKTAYGRTWQFKILPIDLSDYTIQLIY